MSAAGKLLAIAASSGKVGFVYMSAGDLLDWGLSRKASSSVDAAFAQTSLWLTTYHPDLVLVEAFSKLSRKGRHSRALVAAITAAARDRHVRCQAVPKRPRYPNKYAEAAALAQHHPQLEPWLPRPRRISEPEPRNIVYFEALSLAVTWGETDRSAR